MKRVDAPSVWSNPSDLQPYITLITVQLVYFCDLSRAVFPAQSMQIVWLLQVFTKNNTDER